MIKELNEVDWTKVNPDYVSVQWNNIDGMRINVWEKPVGLANNKILFVAKLPASLDPAFMTAIEEGF